MVSYVGRLGTLQASHCSLDGPITTVIHFFREKDSI